MKKLALLLLLIAMVWFIYPRAAPVRLGPGVFAPDDPEQGKVRNAERIPYGDYTLTPLATWHVTGKVLSRRDYWWGREADLSPTDLARGWGRMSDESVLAHFDISQSNRFYRWWTKALPIPRGEVERHSANMHLIPATDDVEAAIDEAREGHIVEFKGRLVLVDAKDGWHWVSSLTRNDTGNGACELIYVEDFTVHPPETCSPQHP